MSLLVRSTILLRNYRGCLAHQQCIPSLYRGNFAFDRANTRMSQIAVYSSAVKVSAKDKLKKAVAEYGSTVIVFHIAQSLLSLGVCYMIISSGVNVEEYMSWFGFKEGTTQKFATGAGTFVAAYAVHKVFAPVRIGITLGATPFIVRYLRKRGILKAPLP